MFLDTKELSETLNSAKYTLRTKSILKRIESERSRHSASKKKECKEKEKPPPLSKYRRKTANARERNRMKEINDAFISLQSSLPDIPGTDTEKLTKITVLKLAVNYIRALARVLDNTSLSMDVEDVRQMWCHDNAHITKTDHTLRSVVKSSSTVTNKKDDSKTSTKGLTITTAPVSLTTSPLTTNAVRSTSGGCVNSATLASPAGSNTSTTTAARKRSHGTAASQATNKGADNLRDKYLHAIKPTVKKSGKSRSRGKICRTNSVATNNGAYITLKNCAMQTTHNPKSRIINNQPLMMSMTVKRTRMEPVVGHRSIKMRKYEPQLSYGTTDLNQFNPTPSCLANEHLLTSPIKTSVSSTTHMNSNARYESKSAVVSSPQYQFLPLHTISPDKSTPFQRLSTCQPTSAPAPPTTTTCMQNKQNYTTATPANFFTSNNSTVLTPIPKSNYYEPVGDTLQYLSVQTNTDGLPLGGLPSFPELSSPPVRNDVLLEFPRETKQSSSSDSAFSSGESSAPSSPTLSLHSSHSPPLEDLSPLSSLGGLSGGSSSSVCSSTPTTTDCDSVFYSLLDCGGPFQEELDQFTSTFITDPTNNIPFNLFIDQQCSSFVNCDIDGY